MRYFVLAVMCAVTAAAQTPAFEAATLKLSPPPKEDRIVINLGRWQTGRFTMANVTLSDMMKFAWSVAADDQLVVPDWNRQVRFDVEATAPAETKMPELRIMLQSLLGERLHLKVRSEQQVRSYLALMKGKSAPKIRQVEEVSSPNVGPQVRGRISHPQMSMQGLVTLLSRFERQTVEDQTGLTGVYEVNLEWSPDNFSAQPDANAAAGASQSVHGSQSATRAEARIAPRAARCAGSGKRVARA